MSGWFKEYSSEQQLLLALPYRDDVWRQAGEPARKTIRQLQQQLSAVVNVSCLSHHDMAYNDIWLRDTLPIWRRSSSQPGWQGLLPKFDGWSGVQNDISADKTLAERLFRAPITEPDWCAEGGMFSHNGEWLLVGFASLKKRNPTVSGEALRASISQQFAPLKPIFIDCALSADETAGHVDNMALFIDDNTLIFSTTDDPNHPDYFACQHLQKALSHLPSNIQQVPLPLPYPQVANAEERSGISHNQGALKRTTELKLLCSYVNAIAVADTLFIPAYGLAFDEIVRQRLQQQLVGKKIVAVAARELILGGGGLHCVSHSVPQQVSLAMQAKNHT